MDFFRLETFDLPKTAADKSFRRRAILALVAVGAVVVIALLIYLLH